MPSTIRSGSRGPDVSTWQKIIGVAQDGVFGPATEAATKKWQSDHGLAPDGVVGPATWGRALGTVASAPSTPGGATVAKLPGIERLSAADLRALKSTADYIGVPVDQIATPISFESKFNPQAVNALSGATGIIQFLPSTANALGTTTGALKRMTFQQQLKYVEKYFAPMRGKLHSLEDVYLYIFSPKGIGQPADYVMYRQGEPGYDQNSALDHGSKGYITRADVTGTIDSILRSSTARIAIPAFGVLGIMFGALLIYGLYEVTKS